MKLKRNLEVALIKASTGREIPGGNGHDSPRFDFGYNGDALDTIVSAANRYNPDILVASEFMFYDGKRILTEDEKNHIESRIASEVQNKDMLVIPGTIMWHNPKEGGLVKNTCPVITGGKVIAEYMKASSGGCEGIAKKHGLSYARGSEQGTIFPWKGIKIGLEICVDHGHGMLKKQGKQVDMHIVSASGIAHYYDMDCSKDNGYFILCDGFDGHSNVILQRKGAEDFEPIEPAEELSGIAIYRLEVENDCI